MRATIIALSLALSAFATPAPQQGNGVDADVGATSAANVDNDDPQVSLTLNDAVIAVGFANDGLSGRTRVLPGQSPSLTSTNNFINFCLTVPDREITDGKQVQEGSCNPAPMGVIPSTDFMPSSKFISPKNGDNFPEGESFDILMAVSNLQLGNFVNAQQNYFAAPQELDATGVIIGHSHITIDFVDSLNDTEPTDPQNFAYFKGINEPDVNGVATVSLEKGLPAGAYRLASINAAANHQPVLVAVEQHGFLDDMVYFTVGDVDENGVPLNANPAERVGGPDVQAEVDDPSDLASDTSADGLRNAGRRRRRGMSYMRDQGSM